MRISTITNTCAIKCKFLKIMADKAFAIMILETFADIFLYCIQTKAFTKRLSIFIRHNVYKDFRDAIIYMRS